MDPNKLLRARNEGKVEWNTTYTIAYYPLHTAEYETVIMSSDWLYFSRYGIITLISRVRGPYGKLWTEFFPSFYGKNEDP